MVCRKGGPTKLRSDRAAQRESWLQANAPKTHSPINDRRERLLGGGTSSEGVPSAFALLIVSPHVVKVPRTCRGELLRSHSGEGSLVR